MAVYQAVMDSSCSAGQEGKEPSKEIELAPVPAQACEDAWNSYKV